MFKARSDVYARFWTNFSNKKSGYAPVYNLKIQSDALNDTVIKSHLLGNETIGVYPLFQDNTCCFLAIDFDKRMWLESALSVLEIADRHNIPTYLEKSKSGNGGHIWIFFGENIPAHKARTLGKILLKDAKLSASSAYDRMFPSQDEHTGKGFGNLVCLPLQGKCTKTGTTVFIDQDGNPVPDQWGYLSSIKQTNIRKVNAIIDTYTPSPNIPNNKSIKATANNHNKNEIHDSPENKSRKVKTTNSPHAQIILTSSIYIPDVFLPDKLYKFLKSKLNFPNPKYYELERRGYSTWQTPKFINTVEIANDGILIPIGFLDEIASFAKHTDIELSVTDNRIEQKKISFSSSLKLRPEQQKVARNLIKHDRVILEAKPGFGKTMVALHVMKRRKQPTLIIVHTKALLHQWLKRIETWFKTKKGDIGVVGDNKWEIGKKVTVASYQTLSRRGLEEISQQFGLVIVDECHHVPAKTFTDVVKQLPAHYVLGLTATAYRRDKLEKLMHFYISPTIIQAKTLSSNTNAQKTTVMTKLITKRTTFSVSNGASNDFHEIGKELIADNARNEVVVTDISQALYSGAKCLVLTERIDHCEILLKQTRFQLLIATGKLIGEGFDWPELTHLFLAYPFSWKGKLVQYVGRVQRQSEGKENAYIYDYLDYDVPMLRAMYFKRLRTYRELNLEKERTIGIRSKADKNQLGLFET